MSSEEPEVHLRVVTSEDAGWMIEVDRQRGPLAHPQGWEHDGLTSELAEGRWATDQQWGWAIMVDGRPAGWALVRDLDTSDASVEVRIDASLRGRGIGREVLSQLADHHFSDHPSVHRLVGRTHDQNVPMQRAFNAAGFRMEARYRDSYLQPDGRYASEWGYALTRADWEAGRHRADATGYDLHGLVFTVEEVMEGDGYSARNLVFKFLQDGRRAIARYSGGNITEGELAGIIQHDVLVYRYIHDHDGSAGHSVITGSGRARVQRRQDNLLEVVNEWNDDSGRHGKTFLVERR